MTTPTNNAPPVAVTGLTFSDNFSTFSASTSGQGTTWQDLLPYGGEAAHTLSGNNEAEYYSGDLTGSNSPFSDTSGVLNINAFAAAPGSNPYNLPYTSGAITTAQSFSQTYGYFEINCELPAGNGLWPAFWMLPTDGYTAELDDFEVVNNSNVVNSTTHGETNGSWSSDFQSFPTPNLSTGFHTFGVDWEPNTVTYYLDGVAYGSAPTPGSMDTAMYMLINLAVGGNGSWPGSPPASTVFPADMKIAWVQAYSTPNTTSVGGSAALTTNATTGIPVNGASSSSSSSTAGSSSGSTTPAPATPTISGTAGGQATTSEAPIKPFSGVTVGDSNSGATENVSITMSGAGGVLKDGSGFSGLTSTPGVYSLTGTAAAVTRELDALSFTPKAGSAGSSSSTSFALTDASSAGKTATDSTTGVIDTDPAVVVATSTPVVTTPTTSSNPTPITTTTPSDPAGVTVGTGPDQLVLQISEDAYQGDAKFTISVNGVQQGGTLTTTAIKSLGETQAFTVDGTFPAGSDTVTVNFLNDLYDGTPTTDRNLYVGSTTINGAAVTSSSLNEYSAGPQSFTFTGPAATTTTPAATSTSTSTTSATPADPAGVTIGTGPDQLVLQVSEDAYQGNALFTISVDGVQQGGTLTTTALDGSNQTQAFTVDGTFAAGSHKVTVDFLNDNGGYGPTDRNLYVDSATINGAAVSGAALNEYASGSQSFNFTEPTATTTTTTTTTPTSPTTSTTTTTRADPFAVTVGSGPDQLALKISEDAYQGNAQFTITVDGVQQGGTLTTSALNGSGETQAFLVDGSFGTAKHTVSVNFLNDLYAGTATTDRNLYVDGASINGSAVASSNLNEYGQGSQSFSFTGNDASDATQPAAVAVPAAAGSATQSSPDTLTVALTEDAYQGNADAVVALDGKTLGSPTVTFLNSGSTAELFTYTGNFGGPDAAHTVSVGFTNDLYAGTSTTDRNLYVKSVSFDGTAQPDQYALYGNGTQNFSLPATTPVTGLSNQHS